jgi:tRNA 2-selenouridine synthase
VSAIDVPSVSAEAAAAGAYTIVDVRSPTEFAAGSVPGAHNLPLLDDGDRALVGTAYQERGPQEARLLALDLVSPRLSVFLRELKELDRGSDRLAVMCWRGGERSRNVVLLLRLIGVHALQMTGGYKAYRGWVRGGLAGWTPDRPVFTLYGYTGAGKTALLHELAEAAPELTPRPAVVDLEGLALHRGSLLGGLNQPGTRTQKDFEARLWDALRRARGDYLVFEGEGARIGRLVLPAGVARAVREGLPLHITASLERRIDTIMAEYAPDGWSESERARFAQALDRIGERLEAEARHRLLEDWTAGDLPAVVRRLLLDYYDPLYLRSSVSGRDFVLSLPVGAAWRESARRLAEGLGRVLEGTAGETPLAAASPRSGGPRRIACSR